MTASDEHFRRSVEQGHPAGCYDGHDISTQMAGGARVPCVVEQAGDGFWCAHAQLRHGVAAFGDGMTREAALDDLRAALDLLLSVVGPCP